MLRKALPLVSALGLVLVGCQSTNTGEQPHIGARAYRPKVGISIPAADHGWTAGLKYWAETSVKDYPDIDWVIKDAKESNEQINDLENMESQGATAVIVVPIETAAVTPIAKKLKSDGLLLVDVSAGLAEPVADLFIEGDNKAFGRHAAEFIAKKLNGKGKVAYLEGLSCTVNTDRVNAFKEVIAGYPGITLVAHAQADWNREKADKAMQNILGSGAQFDVLWAADDDMALGAENALKSAGRDKNVWILGGGGMKDIVKRVMDHDPLYPGDITYPPSMIGYGIQATAAIMRAGPQIALKYTPKHIVLDLDAIDADNAKNYYFPDSIY